MRPIAGIQYLRALAATAVVAFHAAHRAGSSFTIGQAGVDVFFVVSGFLMVAITSTETNPLDFMIARIRRLVPIYWLATAVFIGAAMGGLFPSVRLETPHVLCSFLFLPRTYPGLGETWPLLVQGWTLNYEMFFYALFAVALAIMPRAPERLLVPAIAAIVAVGAMAQPGGTAARFYTEPLLLEFAGGVLVGLYWKRWGAPPGGWLAIAAATLLFAAATWTGEQRWRPVVYGVPAVLLLAGTLGLRARAGGRAWLAPLGLIGDASYSIYLWHVFVLAAVFRLARRLDAPPPVPIALGMALSIVAGILAYRAIERPLQALLKRRPVLVPLPAR